MINPELVTIKTLNETDAIDLLLTSMFPISNQNGSLGRTTVNQLVSLISSIGATSYIPVNSNNLPNPIDIRLGFSLITSGTYSQVNGADIITTASLNIISWNGSVWSFSQAILIPSEYITESELSTALLSKIDITQKGQPLGVATLGSDGRVDPGQLRPDSQVFIGSYDASTNIPDLNTSEVESGWFYLTAIAGTQTILGKEFILNVGDKIIFNGTSFDQISTIDYSAPTPSNQTFIII